MAKEIFEVEEKIAAGKEVAAIKKYKDFRERNEEIYTLAIGLVGSAVKKGNLNAAAMALAQANAATAQIKPLTDNSDAKSGASAIIAYVESERAKE